MASISDGPNPYRPYHIPASQIPPPINATVNPSSTARPNSTFDLGSSARDVLSDLDYSDYLSDASPSVLEVLKKLVDQGLWKYTSILLAQPFEVAKIVLQVQDAGYVTNGDIKVEQEPGYRDQEEPYQSDSEDDSQAYFTSSAPSQSTRSQREYHRRRRYSSSRSPSRHSISSRRSQASTQRHSHTKALTSTSSLTGVLSTLWSSEGAWGVWKGTNSTFWHSVLLSTITSFLRSFFCAVFGLPDPTIAIAALPSPSALARLDILASPSPLTSLILSVSASGLAGLILSPLDIARTRLILTPSTHPPRSILATISSLGSWIVPSSLAPITFLHSTLPTLITASTPLFLRTRLGLESSTTPTSYAALTFFSQAFELGVRLPVETALRRGQLAIAQQAINENTKRIASRGDSESHLQTTVPLGAYKGLSGTWYHIIYEEGSRSSKASAAAAASTLRRGSSQSAVVDTKRRKGQGIEGLYRGWRVGAWGLTGMWIAHFVGGGAGSGTGSSGGF